MFQLTRGYRGFIGLVGFGYFSRLCAFVYVNVLGGLRAQVDLVDVDVSMDYVACGVSEY